MEGMWGTDVLEKQGQKVMSLDREKLKRPSKYDVIMLNDDFTPMDFVIEVLESIFQKPQQEAAMIMLSIHRSGWAVCGTFSYEIAETKINLAMDMARQAEHPLRCVMRKVET